jgi:hypothetical protein
MIRWMAYNWMVFLEKWFTQNGNLLDSDIKNGP